jgi:hypothetical protein
MCVCVWGGGGSSPFSFNLSPLHPSSLPSFLPFHPSSLGPLLSGPLTSHPRINPRRGGGGGGGGALEKARTKLMGERVHHEALEFLHLIIQV